MWTSVSPCVAAMLQKDPGMRPSVNDLLAREPFKSRAKQLLDEVRRCNTRADSAYGSSA